MLTQCIGQWSSYRWPSSCRSALTMLTQCIGQWSSYRWPSSCVPTLYEVEYHCWILGSKVIISVAETLPHRAVPCWCYGRLTTLDWQRPGYGLHCTGLPLTTKSKAINCGHHDTNSDRLIRSLVIYPTPIYRVVFTRSCNYNKPNGILNTV
ncbi:hypothetical protein J6590_002792 [Homalodisca vitripennis]|nr:hypothetical protein J6590_002792 [Homalodisca vitripennis]